MITLSSILKSVDWRGNIDVAFADADDLKRLESALMRIAVWSKQLETADLGNPALCFVRETQIAAQQSAALLGLCIYKASAGSSRTLLETCLYYTFFRTHLDELATLVRVQKYYLTKSDILDYHRLHTPRFIERQEVFGLIGNVEQWYSKISAVVHGQIPGAWNAHSSIRDISFSKETHTLALENFITGEDLVHKTLLCTTGGQLWGTFTPDAKAYLVKGLAGEKRALLGLDSK
jgi:hypothetical protein